MKIEKFPSGSYRMRKMYKGKTYTVVTDYKPTQKEAIALMAKELDKVKGSCADKTFRDSAEEYIKMKSNVFSPSTIKGYRSLISQYSEWFMNMNLLQIENADIINIGGWKTDYVMKNVYRHSMIDKEEQ